MLELLCALPHALAVGAHSIPLAAHLSIISTASFFTREHTSIVLALADNSYQIMLVCLSSVFTIEFMRYFIV